MSSPLPLPFPFPPGGIDPFDRLLAQRRVFLRGRLDEGAATLLAAQLMALDGESADDVTLLVTSAGGPLDAVWPVLDVLAAMRAPVHTTGLGTVTGTAAAVVACGTGTRRLAPHAQVCLRVDEHDEVHGTAEQLGRAAALVADRRAALAARLAVATGRPVAELAAEIERGTVLDAPAAVTAGLADTLL